MPTRSSMAEKKIARSPIELLESRRLLSQTPLVPVAQASEPTAQPAMVVQSLTRMSYGAPVGRQAEIVPGGFAADSRQIGRSSGGYSETHGFINIRMDRADAIAVVMQRMAEMLAAQWAKQMEAPETAQTPPVAATVAQTVPTAAVQNAAATAAVAVPQARPVAVVEIETNRPAEVVGKNSSKTADIAVDGIGELASQSQVDAVSFIEPVSASPVPATPFAAVLTTNRYGQVAGGEMQSAVQSTLRQRATEESDLTNPIDRLADVVRVTTSDPRMAESPSRPLRAGVDFSSQEKDSNKRNVLAALAAGASVLTAHWYRRRKRATAPARPGFPRWGDDDRA